MKCMLVLLGLFLVLGTSAQGISSAAGLYISVKDFGAKGDGKTDDTKAIQKAIDFALQAGYSTQSLPGVYQGIYFGASKTVFFPIGIYSISNTLKVGSYVSFLGEKSVLVPNKAGVHKLVAVEGPGWQTQIEGLQFLSFKTAIALNSNNVDAGKVIISNCDFLNNQMAIELNAKSSITIIRENRFAYNQKVLKVVAGDKVDMHDNWITAGQLSGVHDAQIINYGVLHFNRNLMVPIPPAESAKEPAWINNYYILTVDGARQGAEPGSFTLVNNFALANVNYPVTPNAVVVTNSDCYAVYGSSASYRQPAVLRIINLPNNIVLKDLRGIVDATVMDFTQINVKKAKTLLPYNSRQIKITVENIQLPPFKHANGTDVPAELTPFLVK